MFTINSRMLVDPLDANSRQRGRSRSLGQVSDRSQSDEVSHSR
jgi:hypothetical protein